MKVDKIRFSKEISMSANFNKYTFGMTMEATLEKGEDPVVASEELKDLVEKAIGNQINEGISTLEALKS